jgi:hypothetical protein
MSALTITAGVFVLAVRCSRAELSDGPIGFTGTLIEGVLLLTVPIAIVVYRAGLRTRRLIVPVALISIVSSVAIAMCPPGNMMALGMPLVLVPAFGAVWFAEAMLRRLAKPSRA